MENSKKYYVAQIYLGAQEIGSTSGQSLEDMHLSFGGGIRMEITVEPENGVYYGSVNTDDGAFHMHNVKIGLPFQQFLGDKVFTVRVLALDSLPTLEWDN